MCIIIVTVTDIPEPLEDAEEVVDMEAFWCQVTKHVIARGLLKGNV